MADTSLEIIGGSPLRGRIRMPGGKGISHRALVFAAVAHGESELSGLAPGDDVGRTRSALEALGVTITDTDTDTSADTNTPAGAETPTAVRVEGRGFDGLDAPSAVIDCANSGTTMRFLAGLAAGRPFAVTLNGDSSLRSRPMARVIDPLRALGAHIDGAGDGTRAPLTVRGGRLTGTRLELAVASGQVKTALILAGLQANGVTEIAEPAPSRDHTERMLTALGGLIERIDTTTVRVRPGPISGFRHTIAGDPSSASFFVVAATIAAGSSIVAEGVGLNPGRIAYLDVLRSMGASITTTPRGESLGEPYGDIAVESAPLRGAEIVSREAIVDELPVLAVAAAFADGVTTIREAGELAVKESDRIATVAELLAGLGIRAERQPDGLVVYGGRPVAGRFASHGDHRIAMAAITAAVGAAGVSSIGGWESVSVSYPGFVDDLARLRGNP